MDPERYAYTATRVRAMKTLLLNKRDFENMIMLGSVEEVLVYLRKTTYEEQIKELGAYYKGVELLERVCNRNLEWNLRKVLRISAEKIKPYVASLLRRWDIQNAITVLRGKYSQMSPDAIKKELILAGELSLEDFSPMLNALSFEEALEYLTIHPYFSGFQIDGKELREVEEALIKFHYDREMRRMAEDPSEDARLIESILKEEMDFLNFSTIIKGKIRGMEPKEIRKSLLPPGTFDFSNYLDKSPRMLVYLLKETKFGPFLKKALEKFEKTGSFLEVEKEFEKYILWRGKILMSKHPVSLAIIIGFIYAKMNEVRNIKIIGQGKELGMSPEEIMEYVVIA